LLDDELTVVRHDHSAVTGGVRLSTEMEMRRRDGLVMGRRKALMGLMRCMLLVAVCECECECEDEEEEVGSGNEQAGRGS
jgi:hypothetical protein